MKAITVLLATVFMLLLGGCTVTQSAAYAVNRYCALPEATRAAYREAVAHEVAPHRIHIECEVAE